MPEDDHATILRLLTRARQGEQGALDELFLACRNYLGVVARTQVETWLQAKVDTSDLIQQTLLEAHRDFGRFQGGTGAEWLAWLRRILAHNAADFVRHYRGTAKRQARREVSMHRPVGASGEQSRPAFFDPKDPGESPSQQLIRQERQLQLVDALQQLTDDHREVIMLRNLQRLPFDQVATRMGRSRPAVQMLWMRAIQKLREVLDQP